VVFTQTKLKSEFDKLLWTLLIPLQPIILSFLIMVWREWNMLE